MTERSTNAWLSIGGYARTYGISRNTVKKWLGHHLLETYQFDGLIRIRNAPPNGHTPKPPTFITTAAPAGH